MISRQTEPTELAKRVCVAEQGREPNYACAIGAVTVGIGTDIKFTTEALDNFDVRGSQPLHYDLLVLCAAIEFADRHWKRPKGWARVLHVTVPVFDIATWERPDVVNSLRSVLGHLTCDEWSFQFVPARNSSPIGTRQLPLHLGNSKSFVLAYSDGLDSRAVSSISGGEDKAVCVRLARRKHPRRIGDSYFTQVPFSVTGHGSNESSFRSRGFQFAVLTAITAQITNLKRIVVPESGQGALGAVLLPLHNLYADYRNHPTFFRKMEQFVKAVQGYPVEFEQPRLWSTKGQTLRAFLDLPGKEGRYLTSARSCWQTRWIVNVGVRRHCGLCAACLLRRLSLHAAGVDEPHDAYVISDLRVGSVSMALSGIPQEARRRIMAEYGRTGTRHLHQLARMADLDDDDLQVDASELADATSEDYRAILSKLKGLLVRHAEEWDEFISAQGKESFLKSWMDGGRYGGCE